MSRCNRTTSTSHFPVSAKSQSEVRLTVELLDLTTQVRYDTAKFSDLFPPVHKLRLKRLGVFKLSPDMKLFRFEESYK